MQKDSSFRKLVMLVGSIAHRVAAKSKGKEWLEEMVLPEIKDIYEVRKKEVARRKKKLKRYSR